jgi:hypothetical protein
MRKIGAFFVIIAFAAVICSPPPAAAFGLRIGPFHIGIPFPFGYRHRPLYMNTNPSGADVARGEAQQGVNSALLYPNLALPVIFANVFWPAYSSPWPFGYQAIFATAFAKAPDYQDPHLCQQQTDPGARIIERIRAEISPTTDQMQLLQKLGGAISAASASLAKSCPSDISPRPVARMQLIESQMQNLSTALDMVRPPLQDFEQSLNARQQARFAAIGRDNRSGNFATGCSSPAAIDWSINQIDQLIQPTDAQRDTLAQVKDAFSKAESDLAAHCPTAVPLTALGRLQTIEARLDSAWRAVLSIQVALANFETGLNDEQKARLDQMDLAAAQ